MRGVPVSSANAAGAVGVAALVIGLSACGGVVEREPNLIAGKEAFVEKCGSCHKLNRAGTTGVTGPDLDASFERALADGMGRSTVEGVVRQQIDLPLRSPQHDPETGKLLAEMPPDLVKGRLADDVSAYVASAAARDGEDPGRLADIGVQRAEGKATAQNGTIEIPADPSGSLAYEFAAAEAEAGDLTMESPNESSVPHNIAVEGNGVNEVGEVVDDGGVSEISFDAQPGTYTFYCSVPGHREGGMEGELTVQ